MIRTAFKKIATSNLFSEIIFKPEKSKRSPAWFIEVDPKQIKYISLIPENSESLIGENAHTGICSGHWDMFKRPFSNHVHYKTVSELLENLKFEQTSMFQKVDNGRLSRKEAVTICENLQRILGKLQHKGYLSQYEMGRKDNLCRLGNIQFPEHETLVGMDRNGDFIRLVGGRHRLAISQQIGIKKMPAILSIYHKNALDKLPNAKRMIKGNPEDFAPLS